MHIEVHRDTSDILKFCTPIPMCSLLRFVNLASRAHGISSPRLRCAFEFMIKNQELLLTSSYKPTCWTPSNCRPNHSTPAVIPLPQVAVTRLSPLRIFSLSSVPTAASTALRMSAGRRKVVKSLPSLAVCFLRNKLKVSECECGM